MQQWHPRYKELPRDWENVFVITRVRYIGVLFHTFYYYSELKSMVRYTVVFVNGVRYIGVPQLGC